MTQPTHLDLDAARAAAEAVIQNDGGAECYLLEEELLRVFTPKAMIEVFDRLRKAEAAREGWKWVPVEPTTEMLDAGRESIAADVSGSCGEYVGTTWGTSRGAWESMIAAAPDSTPTDSADSATERKS